TDYILGDGTSGYGGIVGLAHGLPNDAYINGSGSSWAALHDDDFDLIVSSVENINPKQLGFLCSRQFYFQVMRRLSFGKTATTAPDRLRGPNSTGFANDEFMGFPVMWSQLKPTSSGSGQTMCYFGDFVGASMIGHRLRLDIENSRDFLF